MELMTWRNNMSTEVNEFDEHHKKLVGLINELFNAMCSGQGNSMLGKIISELVKYAKYHFAAEERLMATHNYSGHTRQKTEHDNFIKQISDFQRQLQEGNVVLSRKVMQFLKDWLNQHILTVDKEYTPFFQSKGVC